MPVSNLTQNLKNGTLPEVVEGEPHEFVHRRAVSRSGSSSHPRNPFITSDPFLATSPEHTFGSSRSYTSRQSFGAHDSTTSLRRMNTSGFLPKQLKPFKQADVKVLLLENVNQTGQDILKDQGYQVEALKSSLPEDQLIEKIKYGKSTISFLQMTNTSFLAEMYMCLEYVRRPSSALESFPMLRTWSLLDVSASVPTRSISSTLPNTVSAFSTHPSRTRDP